MAVSCLPGVGRKMTQKLQERFNVELCGDLQKLSICRLKAEFGAKTGQLLFSSCRGETEEEELVFDQERKSVSSEINYGIRFTNKEECDKFVTQLSAEVCRRMMEISPTLKAKMLTLKLMVRAECEKGKETAKFMGHGICDSYSKSSNFAAPTNDCDLITKEVLNALTSFMKSNDLQADELRGVGVQLSKFQNKSTAEGSGGGILNYVKKIDHSMANQPSTSSGINTTSNDFNKSTGSTKKSENSNMWRNEELSMSVVDESVLEHLPPDIREEVRGQLATNRKATTRKDSGSFSNTKAYQDLSFSQLDPEFMAALPQDVIDELRSEMKSSNPKTTTNVTAFDRIMAASKKSPSRKKLRSPKNSTSFIKSSNKNVDLGKVVKNINFGDDQVKEEEVKPTHEEEVELATLDGLRKLQDLKQLYRTWIKTSSDGPSENDAEVCQKFLCDVVNENELNLVYDSLKVLRRLCLEANSQLWNEFYNNLVNRLQAEMLQNYGKKLYVNF